MPSSYKERIMFTGKPTAESPRDEDYRSLFQFFQSTVDRLLAEHGLSDKEDYCYTSFVIQEAIDGLRSDVSAEYELWNTIVTEVYKESERNHLEDIDYGDVGFLHVLKYSGVDKPTWVLRLLWVGEAEVLMVGVPDMSQLVIAENLVKVLSNRVWDDHVRDFDIAEEVDDRWDSDVTCGYFTPAVFGNMVANFVSSYGSDPFELEPAGETAQDSIENMAASLLGTDDDDEEYDDEDTDFGLDAGEGPTIGSQICDCPVCEFERVLQQVAESQTADKVFADTLATDKKVTGTVIGSLILRSAMPEDRRPPLGFDGEIN